MNERELAESGWIAKQGTYTVGLAILDATPRCKWSAVHPARRLLSGIAPNHSVKTLVFGSITLLGGLMLTFGEIRRLFTHTTEAVLENIWDFVRGRAFKLTFGLVLLYAGALASYLHFSDDTLLVQFTFPFAAPSRTSGEFFFYFGVGAGIWVLASFLTSATTDGDVFPTWLSNAFYTFVKAALFLAWIAVAVIIYRHIGGGITGDIVGVAFWLLAAAEIKFGTAGGFGVWSSVRDGGADSVEWTSSMQTWWVLDLEERPVLFVMSVLLTLAIAGLAPMAK